MGGWGTKRKKYHSIVVKIYLRYLKDWNKVNEKNNPDRKLKLYE